MFIVGDAEPFTPVCCQLLGGQHAPQGESWPGTCWIKLLLYPNLPSPWAFSAVLSEKPVNKQPV